MYSEHLILLASISISDPSIKRILEIGTFDGQSAYILSRLFPSSQIVTLDLPISSEVFNKTYNRESETAEFVAKRDANLARAKNIEFREVNSLTLTNYSEKFDLIWIDGAHGYPTVAMDVVNSLRLSSSGSYVLIDDIWLRVSESDKIYQSIGGYESLTAIKEAGLIADFTLINKRLSGQFNFPSVKKYIGVFIKPESL